MIDNVFVGRERPNETVWHLLQKGRLFPRSECGVRLRSFRLVSFFEGECCRLCSWMAWGFPLREEDLNEA